MSAESGFWPAPRSLARLLEDGAVTPRAFALATYIGLRREGESDGVSFQGLGHLARLLGVSERTVQRDLERLVELRVIDHDLRQGRGSFRARVGPRARWGSATTYDGTYDGEGADDDVPHSRQDIRHADLSRRVWFPLGSGIARRSSSDATPDSRARAEKETETETTASVKSCTDVGLVEALGDPDLRASARRACVAAVGGGARLTDVATDFRLPESLVADLLREAVGA